MTYSTIYWQASRAMERDRWRVPYWREKK